MGAKTFTDITTPHGDNHDLWIDPNDPQRMILGNDGGACVSFNGGESWSTIYNQLTLAILPYCGWIISSLIVFTLPSRTIQASAYPAPPSMVE